MRVNWLTSEICVFFFVGRRLEEQTLSDGKETHFYHCWSSNSSFCLMGQIHAGAVKFRSFWLVRTNFWASWVSARKEICWNIFIFLNNMLNIIGLLILIEFVFQNTNTLSIASCRLHNSMTFNAVYYQRMTMQISCDLVQTKDLLISLSVFGFWVYSFCFFIKN